MSRFALPTVFICGTLFGALLSFVLISHMAMAQEDGPFRDVPSTHYAAGAITLLKSDGILTGDPGNVFHGDDYVTRYELAVTLARFTQYYEHSKEPLIQPQSKADWAKPAQSYLASNGFLTPDSPILAPPGNKPVTADQFAHSIAQTVSRLSDRSLPPTPNAD